MIGPLLDLIYPPLCLSCKERCSTKHLCAACWELSAPLDPAERCRHCFGEKEGICKECRPAPALPIPRASVFDARAPIRLLREPDWDALAGFAYIQWARLDWPHPDALIPLKDRASFLFARALGRLIQAPLAKEANEGQILYLLDAGNPLETLRQAALDHSESFPRKMFLFSLFHDAF